MRPVQPPVVVLFALKPHKIFRLVAAPRQSAAEFSISEWHSSETPLHQHRFALQRQINHALTQFFVTQSRRRRRLGQQARLRHARQRVHFQHHRRTVHPHHHVHTRTIPPAPPAHTPPPPTALKAPSAAS